MVLPDAYVEPKVPGPVGRLIRAIRNRRAHRRNLRQARIFLFSDSEFLTPAILVDESEGGGLVWAPKGRLLPKAVFALDHTTGHLSTLELAWRAGKRAGFRITSRDQLDVYANRPELEHIRQFWATMAGPQFH